MPGREYEFHVFSASDYGKHSVMFNVTRSFYTDDVINYSTVTGDDAIEFHVQIASGVGKYVAVDFESVDYPSISRRATIPFM